MKLTPIPQDYKAQLAESHARETKLREALSELKDLMEDVCKGDYRPDSFTTQPSRIALAIPSDATALNELIAERIAELTKQLSNYKTDAERYSFIKSDEYFWMEIEGVICRNENLDIAIDKARKTS